MGIEYFLEGGMGFGLNQLPPSGGGNYLYVFDVQHVVLGVSNTPVHFVETTSKAR